MGEAQPASGALPMSFTERSALLFRGSGDEDDDSDWDPIEDTDTPAPKLSRGSTHGGTTTPSGSESFSRPHPFHRSSSSPVDEKLEDWVRTSRHRLLADASLVTAPERCRALTVYKPLPMPGVGGEDSEEDEGGGAPTPSPRVSSGNDGDEEAASQETRPQSPRGERCGAQCAGSGSAEGAAATGGGRNTADLIGQRGVQSGGTLAHSADDAGGSMSDVWNNEGRVAAAAVVDAMDMAPPPQDDYDVSMGPWQGVVAQSVLTRTGTSRGAPTPELTPEWVARARVRVGGVYFVRTVALFVAPLNSCTESRCRARP